VIHIRTDDIAGKREFLCGIVGDLPKGDTYFFEDEPGAWLTADCPGCNPGGQKKLGTPISQLSSTPGSHGFENFKRVADAWGFE